MKNPFSQDLEKNNLDLILLITTISGIFISLFCLYFLVFKQKLNENLKSIMKKLVLQNLISFILMTIGLVLILCEGIRTKVSCYMILAPTFFNLSGNFFWISLISSLRYYMTERASQTRILSQEDINGYTQGRALVCCVGKTFCTSILTLKNV